MDKTIEDFFGNLEGILFPKEVKEEDPTAETEEGYEDSDLFEGETYPYEEAMRILEDLEDTAGENDTDLLMAIADRYIEIGRLINL